MIATEHKSNPKPHHNPGNPGNPGEETEGQAVQPFATATASLMLTNSSITPGPVWFEMTNPTAFALAVGTNTLTSTLPVAGAAWWSQYFDLPLMCAVYTPPTFVPDPGLPVPQSAVKLTNSAGSGLPATAGVRTVTVSGTPPVITITVYAQTAGTVAAGSRWLVFSAQGV